MSTGEIGQKVGRILHRHKMAKHFRVSLGEGTLTWTREETSIAREAALDGIYVIRTSEPSLRLSAEDTVRSYKRLSEVEESFRYLKGSDLRVRPVFHREEDRVRAHPRPRDAPPERRSRASRTEGSFRAGSGPLLCMLAYYVEWHMRYALAPILFEDEAVLMDRATRDPVAPPEPSLSVKAQKKSKQTPEGLPVHSFETLLWDLATQARVTYMVVATKATFDRRTPPTPLQEPAFSLPGL